MPGSSPRPVCARVISLPSIRILSMETGRFVRRTDVSIIRAPTSACGTCGSTTMIRRRRQRGPLPRRRPRHQLRRVRLPERRRRRVRLPGHRHRRSRLPGPHLRRNPLFCICRSYCAEVTWEITLRSGGILRTSSATVDAGDKSGRVEEQALGAWRGACTDRVLAC